jgi:acetyl-CoA/propionyl-CoA carboxylase biotin carboxyl carrier protein
MLRAIDETVVEGVATTLPADVAILSHPDFIAGEHSTNWVENGLDLSALSNPVAEAPPASSGDGEQIPRVLRDVTAEVDGRRYEVKLWVPDIGDVVVGHAEAGKSAGPKRPKAAAAGAGSGTVAVPMQGTIVKVLVAVGDQVEVGQTVCVLEAMKMENNVNAEKAGTVSEVKVEPGASVGPGDVVLVIE